MESVIKVLLQLCKEYWDKHPRSKKEIAAVLTRLEQEGEIGSTYDVLDHRWWDSLTHSACAPCDERSKGC